MVQKYATRIVIAISLTAFPAAVAAQDAKTVLNNAAKAMGAENLQTIQYSGSGFNFAFGQSMNPDVPWPRFAVKTYTREIDFTAPASHVALVRTGAETRGGGFVAITVDQTQEQWIAPNAQWAQQVDIWMTPYGFLKRAMEASNVTVKSRTIGGRKYNVVTYTVENRYPLNESRENPGGDFADVTYLIENKYKLKAYINNQNMIESVETWLDNPVLGDMLVETTYTAYQDFGGFKFPTRIVEKRGGFPVLELSVTQVTPNAAVSIEPSQQGGGSGAAGTRAQTDKIADGVFHIKGQEHSVAVEFKDYVVVVEAPVSEARSLAVLAETRKLVPNKPIKYLINTHHHFDHIGGLRTYVAEGATIVTHRTNKAFYEKIFAMRHSLNADKLSKSKKKADIETVADKKVLTDGIHTMELYFQQGNPHAESLIFAYLPQERILIEADAYNPPASQPGGFPLPLDPPFVMNLVENIERLRLNIDRILPIHGPGAITKADLYKAVGKTTTRN